VREETQQDTCVYCGKPITDRDRPYKRLESGEKAHLSCYLEHEEKEEGKTGH
jgi:hypothetical protein